MRRTFALFVTVVAIMLLAISCGDDNRLLSIQVLPLDPAVLSNNTVYVAPGGTVQYQAIGWYSNRTSQTLDAAQVKWTSSNTSIAGIDGQGFATSAGPVGVTTITAEFKGHTSTSALSVCDFGLCPP